MTAFPKSFTPSSINQQSLKRVSFQDHVNRELLLEIVRYKSSKVDDVTSLDDYIKRAEGKREKGDLLYHWR